MKTYPDAKTCFGHPAFLAHRVHLIFRTYTIVDPCFALSDANRPRRKGLEESFLAFRVVTTFWVVCCAAFRSQLGHIHATKRFDEIN